MHRICSLPFSSRAWHLLRPWTGLFWDSSIRDPTIPGPSHILQPVLLCPLTHKTRVRLGNWFTLCLTRTSLEPTDMGMQILAEFCVVLPPLSLCFLTAQFGGGRETRKQLALNVLELLSRDANSPLAGCCGSFWGFWQLCLNPIAIPGWMRPVLGVRMSLVVLLSLHSPGLEQQRAVPCWKVQPEKDANDTQPGVKAALESCCSIKGGEKTPNQTPAA